MSSMNDESLLQEFVVESREHLSAIEPDLLTLEQKGENAESEIINRVFRAIHSIKGASGFFGLEALKTLSHSMENLLMMVRDGQVKASSQVVDPLLVGVDRLRIMLDDVGSSEQVPFKDVVERLEILISGKELPADETVAQKTETQAVSEQTSISTSLKPDRDAVEAVIRHGQKLVSIQLCPDVDLKQKNRTLQNMVEVLTSTGVILGSTVDAGSTPDPDPTSGPIQFIYASVLEADLLSISLNLPQSQICPIQPADILGTEEASATAAFSATPNATAKEEKQAKLKSSAGSADSTESVRVKVDLLNRLMDLAGEMVLARNQLTRAFESQSIKGHGIDNIIQNVNLVTSDLQEHIMQTRMQPVGSVFGKFPRLVRDLSRQLGKEIELKTSGDDVELDKSLLESLSDPLTHLIRNCCDHAIELPNERLQNGKARHGTIILHAYQESGHINLAITDDGRGINPAKIIKKALEQGLLTEHDIKKMTPQEQVNLIFLPGLSTAEKVSDVSGRGVGMDVVKTNIEQIGGNISIETEIGSGTTILLRLPLTLAIIPSLIVQSAGQTFAVPQINLVELVSVKASQIASRIEKVGSAAVLRLRGKLLPLVRLSDILNISTQYYDEQAGGFLEDNRKSIEDSRRNDTEKVEHFKERRKNRKSDYNILVLKAGTQQYGLIVDDIRDIEEIVVKPLSHFIKGSKCFSGATIMGDGRVAMILDTSGIVAISELSFTEIDAEQERLALESANKFGAAETAQRQSIILFNNAASEIFAVPLSSVLRLEKFQLKDVERIGHKRFLPYRGKSLSLLYLDEYLPVGTMSDERTEAYIIIPTDTDCKVGIVASQIIDTIDLAVSLETSFIQHEGVSGSAVINNHTTLFINPTGLLQAAGLSNAQRSFECPSEPLQLLY